VTSEATPHKVGNPNNVSLNDEPSKLSSACARVHSAVLHLRVQSVLLQLCGKCSEQQQAALSSSKLL
jgi:hypothetical protein